MVVMIVVRGITVGLVVRGRWGEKRLHMEKSQARRRRFRRSTRRY